MAENSIQESFIYEWLSELLAALPDTISPTVLPSLFEGCSNVHYRQADIDTFIAPYIGKLDDFFKALSEQWNWKITYDRDAGLITVNENKAACVCPIVQTHPDMPATLCHCSERFAEKMFSAVTKIPVKATVIRSILRGDPSCVYQINLARSLTNMNS
jgi:hypothetical protein